MPINYPFVHTEWETLKQMLLGKSIARYGDGEFNIVKGGNCVSQVGHVELTDELKKILKSDNDKCLIGIPNMTEDSPKAANWNKYKQKYATFMNPKKIYYSSFITRPDSAPWIDTELYWTMTEDLWRGKDVVLVHGGERSLRPEMMTSAHKLVEVISTRRDAFFEIDKLEKEIKSHGIQRVIMCLGATATCLAHRLSLQDFHALDVGHIGMFMRKKGQYHAITK